MLPKKRQPVHPGEVLSQDFLKPQSITAAKFAEALGGKWTEKAVNDIIAGKENISEKAAKAFAEALDTTEEFWVSLQNNYLQWEERHRKKAI